MSLHEDMSAAERDFFASRGRNTDALLAENKDGVQRVTDETPVQSVPDAGADRRDAPELGGPSDTSQAAAHPPSPAAVQDETKSAPAPIEDAEEAPDPQTGHPKRVRWARYQAERERAEALDKQYKELQEKWTRLDERVNLFNEALKDDAPQQVEEDPEPDKLQDAYGYMEWQNRQIQKLQANQEQWRRQQEEAALEQRINQAYLYDAQRFQAQQPLFKTAYDWLIANRLQQLENMEPWSTPEQRMAAVQQEERNHARNALSRGISPAETLFNQAKLWGFEHWYAAQQQNNQSPAPAGGNGGAAPAAHGMSPPGVPQTVAPPANPQVPNAVQQVQAIAANQNAARSLSNGGGAPLQNIDARALASMSQEEFEAVFNRLQNSRNKAQLRELMGY